MVSIIGTDYLRPAVLLIKELFGMADPYDVDEHSPQTNHIQNGYSASICLILVACLESFFARYSYLVEPNKKASRIEIGNFIKFFLEKNRDYQLKDELIETYILRDTLIHNHLLEINYDINFEAPKYNIRGSQLYDRSGDPKYKGNVNENTRKTMKLELNVNPVRVDRHDVRKVLKVVWQTISYLESINTHISISHIKDIPFNECNPLTVESFINKIILDTTSETTSPPPSPETPI